jgi:hypothetical protein
VGRELGAEPRRERDDAALAGLRGAIGRRAVLPRLDRALDAEATVEEVNVPDAERVKLARAQARVGRGEDEQTIARRRHRVGEGADLGVREEVHLAVGDARQRNARRRVDRDHALGKDGGQGRVDLADRRRGDEPRVGRLGEPAEVPPHGVLRDRTSPDRARIGVM